MSLNNWKNWSSSSLFWHFRFHLDFRSNLDKMRFSGRPIHFWIHKTCRWHVFWSWWRRKHGLEWFLQNLTTFRHFFWKIGIFANIRDFRMVFEKIALLYDWNMWMLRFLFSFYLKTTENLSFKAKITKNLWKSRKIKKLSARLRTPRCCTLSRFSMGAKFEK